MRISLFGHQIPSIFCLPLFFAAFCNQCWHFFRPRLAAGSSVHFEIIVIHCNCRQRQNAQDSASYWLCLILLSLLSVLWKLSVSSEDVHCSYISFFLVKCPHFLRLYHISCLRVNLSHASVRRNARDGIWSAATHWPDDKRHRHVWCNPSQMALSLVRPFIASLSAAKLCPADKGLIFARTIYVGKYIFQQSMYRQIFFECKA